MASPTKTNGITANVWKESLTLLKDGLMASPAGTRAPTEIKKPIGDKTPTTPEVIRGRAMAWARVESIRKARIG